MSYVFKKAKSMRIYSIYIYVKEVAHQDRIGTIYKYIVPEGTHCAISVICAYTS